MNWVLPPKLFIAGAISALAFMVLFPILNQFALFISLFPLFSIILTQPFSKECQIIIVMAWLIVFIASGLHISVFYLFYIIGPSFIVNRQYFRSYKIKQKKVWFTPGLLLTDLLVWSMMSVVIMFLILPLSALQLDMTNTFSQIAQDPLYPKYQTTFSHIKQLFEKLLYYHYGINIVISNFLIIATFNKVQKIIVKNKINRRPPMKLSQMELPKWYGGLLIVSGCLWVMLTPASTIALVNTNILIIILSGFFLQGLSIVHNLFKDAKNKQMILVLFYLVMILFTLLILLVTLLGILEPWLQVRQQFSIRKE